MEEASLANSSTGRVRQMKDKGHFPNVFTYTMLIEGFCIASRVDEAFGVFETMKDSGVYPNEATVRALVHGVFRCVDPSKALELLSEFLDREQEQERVHFMLACDTVLYCLANNSMAKEMVVFLRRVLGRGLPRLHRGSERVATTMVQRNQAVECVDRRRGEIGLGEMLRGSKPRMGFRFLLFFNEGYWRFCKL